MTTRPRDYGYLARDARHAPFGLVFLPVGGCVLRESLVVKII